MQSEKASKIIAAVKALPDQDADILEAFLAGLRIGGVCGRGWQLRVSGPLSRPKAGEERFEKSPSPPHTPHAALAAPHSHCS